MKELDKSTKQESFSINGKKIRYTIFPRLNWIALGSYEAKTGGMDTISTKVEKQSLLRLLWTEFPDYDILMEGVIDSTILSTYVDLFKDYENMVDEGSINPRRILIVSFLPPLETCIARVYERNGGKPVLENQIESKWKSVERNHLRFKQAGLTSVRVDTSKVTRQGMLPAFLKLANKYRGD